MAGLQDISPMVAKPWVTSAVRAPMRAAAARSLAAGMAAADHDHVVGVGIPRFVHGACT